jgi:hypothetical protein
MEPSPCLRGPEICHTCGAAPGEACPFDDLTPGLLVHGQAVGAVRLAKAEECAGGDVCESCQ